MRHPSSEYPTLAGQIGRASVIIIIWSLLDKVLAIGKEMMTAHRFGVSTELDIFNVAILFPGIVTLVFFAVLVSAFVPLYLEWSHQSSPQSADSHAAWLIHINTIFFALLTLLCLLIMPLVFPFLGYGFGTEEKLSGIVISRFLTLLIFIDGAGILLRGMLLARKLFFHLYVAPIFVNITLIIFLVGNWGYGIYDLVWGFLIGSLLKTLYMGVILRREGFDYRPTLPFDPKKLKALCLLALPLLGSELIANANLMVDQVMATLLPAGSVSTLRYAFRINDLPIQVVITAVSRAIFPFISEEAARGNKENLRNIYKYTLIFLGFITIPLTCLLILFSEDLVTVLLRRGAFDHEAARHTAQVLICYSLGLFFYAYTFVNGSFFAALQSTKTLLYMGIVSVFLNVFFNFLFMHLIGLKGIALSTSVTMAIISLWFIFLLKKRLGIVNLKEITPSLQRLSLAALVMLGTGFLLLELFLLTPIPRLVYTAFTAVVVTVFYLVIIWIIRTEELAKSMEGMIGLIGSLAKRKS